MQKHFLSWSCVGFVLCPAQWIIWSDQSVVAVTRFGLVFVHVFYSSFGKDSLLQHLHDVVCFRKEVYSVNYIFPPVHSEGEDLLFYTANISVCHYFFIIIQASAVKDL